jgi:hypothetical protein
MSEDWRRLWRAITGGVDLGELDRLRATLAGVLSELHGDSLTAEEAHAASAPALVAFCEGRGIAIRARAARHPQQDT